MLEPIAASPAGRRAALPTLGRFDAFSLCFTAVIAAIAAAFAVALVRSGRATTAAATSSSA